MNMKGKGDSAKKNNGNVLVKLVVKYTFFLILAVIIAYVILNKANFEASFGYGKSGVTGEMKTTTPPATSTTHPSIKVDQEIDKVKGEVTAVKAPNQPLTDNTKIHVIQKARNVEGSATGVDISKTPEKKK